jgi:hypothetical protein
VFLATVSAFGMGTVEAFTSPGIPSMKEKGDLGELRVQEQSLIASLALVKAQGKGINLTHLSIVS